MKKIIDLVGKKFGSWTVLSYVGKEKSAYKWLCRCSCGVEMAVSGNNLRNGLTTSCNNCSSAKRRKIIVGDTFGKLIANIKKGAKCSNAV